MHKISSKTEYESIRIKFYLQKFVSIIGRFYHLFAITNKSILYNWNFIVNDWFICQANAPA